MYIYECGMIQVIYLPIFCYSFGTILQLQKSQKLKKTNQCYNKQCYRKMTQNNGK